MEYIYTVRRRDMFSDPCVVCAEGSYVILGFFEGEELLECSVCTSTVHRWLTKKEVMELRQGETK